MAEESQMKHKEQIKDKESKNGKENNSNANSEEGKKSHGEPAQKMKAFFELIRAGKTNQNKWRFSKGNLF